jgi:hypothetical protein
MIQSPLPGSSLGPINRSHSAGRSDLDLECEGEAEELPMVANQDYQTKHQHNTLFKPC